MSLAPRDATQGGLIDDVNVTILDAVFALTDYDGKADQASPALIVQYEPEQVEGAEPVQKFDQIYSAGSSDHFMPSDDNTMLIPVGNKTGINNSTNCFKFLTSMVECGFPEDTLAQGDIRCIIGTKGHVKRVAQPKRTGLLRNRAGEDDTREKTTLIFESISELPEAAGEAAPAPTPKKAAAPASKAAVAGKANGAAKTPPPAAAVEEADDDLDTTTYTALTEILTFGEPTEKKSIPAGMFQLLTAKVKAGEMDPKTKTAVIARAGKEEFLNSLVEQGLAEYDGAVITLVPTE